MSIERATAIARAGARCVLLLVGCGLLVLGCIKLSDRESFVSALTAQNLLSVALVRPVSLAVPVIEGLLGGLLIVGVLEARHAGVKLLWWASVCSASLFLTFSAYALCLSVVPPPKPVSCGCGISFRPVHHWGWLGAADAGVAVAMLGAAFFSPWVRPARDAGGRARR